jgi:hypothetical protein
MASACVALLGGCAGPDDAPQDVPGSAQPGAIAEAARLGPVDGHDLSPTDLDRIQVGDLAPDFVLDSHADGIVALSDFRGRKNVVLVMYRGHW